MDDRCKRLPITPDEPTEGGYVYGVTSTGVFCRPSCRSRTPKPEHVRIFRTPAEALAAGFRPCKRCRPEAGPHDPDAALAEAAKALMRRRFRERLTLATLAKALAISPYHLHRVFKRVTGTTPGRFLLLSRIQAAEEALRSGTEVPVAHVAQSVGFQSPSHFATVFRRTTGMTPTAYRAARTEGTRRGEEAH
jgi:AraC family transcriptional regulator of adaptative response / methylphosphotriester-DNA alkyltransferase methyltransferase